MNIISSILVGALSLAFWSWVYPMLHPYLFINANIEPIIGPCRDSFSIETCTVLARVCLWFMDLPLNFIVLLLFSAVAVGFSQLVKTIRLSAFYIFLGCAIGFAVLYYIYPAQGVHYSYHIVNVATLCFLLLSNIWLLSHLTSKGAGRANALSVL